MVTTGTGGERLAHCFPMLGRGFNFLGYKTLNMATVCSQFTSIMNTFVYTPTPVRRRPTLSSGHMVTPHPDHVTAAYSRPTVTTWLQNAVTKH